jgi:peptidoglycan/LPS O-acetylase OafA/YrhL
MNAYAAYTSRTVKQIEASPLRYQQLDILHCLRGFCAFYVVIFHAKYILWAGGRQFLAVHPRVNWDTFDYVWFGFDMLSAAGYEMVIFFFVLSGFFIKYAQHKKHRNVAAFYLNRVERIYPPFIISLLLAAGVLTLLATQMPQILTIATGRELNITLTQAWAELCNLNALSIVRALNFTRIGEHFLGDNVVYWSLLPEALFYVLVPLALWQLRWYYIVSVALFVVGLYCDWQAVPLGALARYALTYNAYFAAGMGLYDVVVKTIWLSWVARLPRRFILILLLVLLMLLIGLALLKLKIVATVLAGILAVLVISVLLAGHLEQRLFFVRILHKIGEFSFSLYLYHYPLLLLFYAGLVYFTHRLFVYERIYWLAIPLITVICYALYWVTERMFVQYFRRQ